MIRTTIAGLATASAAFVLAGSGLGQPAARTPTIRGSVGPGFHIQLTKQGKRFTSLRPGLYRFVIADRSREHDFVLEREGGRERQLTSLAFTGTRAVTVRITNGVWRFYCEPHASVMSGRFSAGAASAAGDDRGAHREPEPGDDRGGHGEPQPGDDHGGR